jgi:hypothetical protein
MSTDGNHRVTVVIDDPSGTAAALAWANATYTKLLEMAVTADANNQSLDYQDGAPQCGVHHQSMVLVDGRLGNFWSCHHRNPDGSWCKYRPSNGQPLLKVI